MNSRKYYILILIGVIFCLISSAALFFSYRAYVASSIIGKKYNQSHGKLEQELKKIEARLAALQNQKKDKLAHRMSGTKKTVVAPKKQDSIVKERESLRRLERIVESTGLDQLATSQNMDPTILTEMYEEYADRKQADQRHEQQQERNEAYHKADADQYGQELMILYEQARLRRRGNTDKKESDWAFAELLAKYPEAFATGMVIAERALYSGFRRNTSDVEKYYDMLLENEKFSHIVTDRGIEAMPNIEYYLAREYLRQGDRNSALTFIESLEDSYPDSLLYIRGAGRDRRWQPVSRVISRLRKKANLPE